MCIRDRNIPTELYTDADAFADLCAMKRDIYAGYLGFCTDGHGDIQWPVSYTHLDVYKRQHFFCKKIPKGCKVLTRQTDY